MRTGDNLKYGKLITDGQYIHQVILDMQDKIDVYKDCGSGYYIGEEYSEDGMKDVISGMLDDLDIYPDDIDYVFSELKF